MARPKNDIERRVFSTRLSVDLIKRLKYLAADRDVPLNRLIEEAVESLLKKYKK